MKLSKFLDFANPYIQVKVFGKKTNQLLMYGTVAQCLFSNDCEAWSVNIYKIESDCLLIEVSSINKNTIQKEEE